MCHNLTAKVKKDIAIPIAAVGTAAAKTGTGRGEAGRLHSSELATQEQKYCPYCYVAAQIIVGGVALRILV